MTIVIDASLLLAIYLEEPNSVAARSEIGSEDVIAPALIAAEVGNGVWRAHRTGRLSGPDARGILPRALGILTRVAPEQPLAGDALDLSIRYDHPIYDCFYVALARQEGLPLVTGDRRLAGRFGGEAAIRLVA